MNLNNKETWVVPALARFEQDLTVLQEILQVFITSLGPPIDHNMLARVLKVMSGSSMMPANTPIMLLTGGR